MRVPVRPPKLPLEKVLGNLVSLGATRLYPNAWMFIVAWWTVTGSSLLLRMTRFRE